MPSDNKSRRRGSWAARTSSRLLAVLGGWQSALAKRTRKLSKRTRFVLVTGSYVVLIGAALAYPRVARRFHPDTKPVDSGVGTVNGQSISATDFYTALRAERGLPVVRHLMQRVAIAQEAEREKITLSPSEVTARLEKIDQDYEDPALRTHYEAEMRSELLLHKLLLRGVTEEQKVHFYDTFKPALIAYDISVISVTSPSQAQSIQTALSHGAKFDAVADQYAQGPHASRSIGQYDHIRRPDLERAIGHSATELLVRQKPGGFVRGTNNNNIVFITVRAVHDSYNDLKPAIEDTLAETNRVRFLYDLMSRATLTNVFLKKKTDPSQVVKPLPGNLTVQGTGTALPGNKPVEGGSPVLPGSKAVHDTAPVLPGNKTIHEEPPTLPGNKTIQESATPVLGSPNGK